MVHTTGRSALGNPSGLLDLGSPPGGACEPEDYQLRPLRAPEVSAVARWHIAAFPAGFFAQLGAGFMETWMREHLISSASVGLVAVSADDEVVGYLLGTTDDAASRSRGSASARRLLLRGGCALLARPSLWVDFVRLRARPYAGRILRRMRASEPSLGSAASREGELLYICVEPHRRRQGAGTALLAEFTRACQLGDSRIMSLVTEADNYSAQRFYLRHGWQIGRDTPRALDGRILIRMERTPSGAVS